MKALWVAWLLSAGALLLLYGWAGWSTPGHLGVLVDTRGRYSLSRFQLALWTLVILPLIAGVFIGRAFVRGTDPFDFSVPTQVIALLGLSVATTAVATGVKAHKNRTRPEFVAASKEGKAALRQIVSVEEGPNAETVDFTKLQHLALAVLLACGYVVTCIHDFLGAGPQVIMTPDQITALPALNTTFVTLLGLSQLGYVAGKLPNRGGALITPAQAALPNASLRPALAAPAFSLRDKLRGDSSDEEAASATETDPDVLAVNDEWRQRAAAKRSVQPTDHGTGSGTVTPANGDGQ